MGRGAEREVRERRAGRGLLAAALAAAGCAGGAEPAPPPAAAPDPAARPAASSAASPLPDAVQPAGAWQDASEGRQATLVYVTERGRRDQTQAAAIVVSSDPDNAHFQRESSPRVTVLRARRAALTGLLLDLERLGLERLPWTEQPYDAEIGPARALYHYEGGKRRVVFKDALDGPARGVFTEVEKRVIRFTLDS